MTRPLYRTCCVFTAINEEAKNKLHTLRRKKEKEISGIVKNYDYSSFYLSPTRKKKHNSRSYLFLKGMSEKDRQIEKKDIYIYSVLDRHICRLQLG